MKYYIKDRRTDDRFCEYADRVAEWHRYVNQYDDDDIYEDSYLERIIDSSRDTVYVGGVWA